MFTRRCSERRFFLRPDAETNNTFWYCLGWAAQKHGIVLHAAVAMSNHVHVAATDPYGVYPNFLRDFHAFLARAMNALRGRWEHFWDANQASAVLLEDAEAQLEKVLYVLANPLDLVEKAQEWPGATSLRACLGGAPIVATIPKHFFRDDQKGGDMPPTISVSFQPPPALEHLSMDQYVEGLQTSLADKEATAAADRRTRGVFALGRKRILAQHWNDCPDTPEPRRELSPTVACRDKWRRIERLASNRDFQDWYRTAFESFRRGLDAVFPVGTWLMRFRAAIAFGTS